MAPRPDVVAEHAALLVEKAELQRLCMEEFATMSCQVAVWRAERLLSIKNRFSAIVRTKAWKGRPRRDA